MGDFGRLVCLSCKVLNFDGNGQFKTWIKATRDMYLLTAAVTSAQTGHRDFHVKKNAISGSFFNEW